MRRVVLAGIICLSLALLLTSDSFSQGFSVSPLQFDFKVAPGESQNFSIRLANFQARNRLHLEIYLVDFLMKANGSVEFLPPGASEWSCTDWIKLSTSKLILRPKEKRVISGRLIVPRGVSGGRYAVIMVHHLPPSTRLGHMEAVSTDRFAIFVRTTIVPGKIEEKMEIVDFKVLSGKTPSFVASIKNTGNIHFMPIGKVIIKDKLGRIKDRIPLQASRSIIFPEAIRDFRGTMSRKLPTGKYTAEARFHCDKRKLTREKVSFFLEKGFLVKEGVKKAPHLFSFAPSSLEVKAVPGGLRSSLIGVKNLSETPLKIRAELKDISVGPDGDLVYLKPGTAPLSCAKWIRLRPSKISLNPGKTRNIQVISRVPQRVQSGERYAQILLEARNSDNIQRLGIGVEMVVPGALIKAGKIVDLKVSKPKNERYYIFTALFKNTGNAHLVSRGRIVVKDERGSVVINLPFDEDEVVILPDGIRRFAILYPQEMKEGEYTAIAAIQYGEEKSAVMEEKFRVESDQLE